MNLAAIFLVLLHLNDFQLIVYCGHCVFQSDAKIVHRQTIYGPGLSMGCFYGLMPYRGTYRIFPKGGRGLSQVWIFHTWTFRSGTNHVVYRQNTSRQNAGGQNTSQNCRGDKTMVILWDRKDKSYENTYYIVLMVR